ncbi:hypothetical protein SEVIR_7G146300v4 [Setaria viridis]|uniref:Uncharacterized protein n=1 Tax=Setaria viridis TaxID=4556 RepID=A0A4U6TV47_SETVI|nr:hypothetical protein SEVIR_7G146300v2 [Setaria viridis]
MHHRSSRAHARSPVRGGTGTLFGVCFQRSRQLPARLDHAISYDPTRRRRAPWSHGASESVTRARPPFCVIAAEQRIRSAVRRDASWFLVDSRFFPQDERLPARAGGMAHGRTQTCLKHGRECSGHAMGISPQGCPVSATCLPAVWRRTPTLIRDSCKVLASRPEIVFVLEPRGLGWSRSIFLSWS